jgi:hypothetical protein
VLDRKPGRGIGGGFVEQNTFGNCGVCGLRHNDMDTPLPCGQDTPYEKLSPLSNSE